MRPEWGPHCLLGVLRGPEACHWSSFLFGPRAGWEGIAAGQVFSLTKFSIGFIFVKKIIIYYRENHSLSIGEDIFIYSISLFLFLDP